MILHPFVVSKKGGYGLIHLFDTHAHYDDTRFDEDRQHLLSTMPQQGVAMILNPGCDLESSQKAVAYAHTYPWVYAAVGYHPENIEMLTEEQLADGLRKIEQLAKDTRVKAIGEIGLDYYWCKDTHARKRQQEVFRAQMRMAKRCGLPVIVHDREAHLDSLTIVEQYADVPCVFHCYSGSAEFAQQLLALGCMISFTGVITFRNAKKAREVITKIPMEHIMIETDAPYMAPEPYRGKRNSSLYVYRVAETIAEIKGISVEEVARITMENGKRFFRTE